MKLIFFLLFIATAYSDTDITSPVFRPPQWATASRPVCLSPFGCLGYNTDTQSYDYFDGTIWKNIGAGGGGGTGDVVGPATVLDSSVALFDGTTGKLLKGIMCASGEILQSNGSAFVCATAGGGGIIVEDVLTSTSAVNALSANQGKILNDRLLLAEANAHTHANKPVLDGITNAGFGLSFLADDGTYKVPIDTNTVIIVEDVLTSNSSVNALSAYQGNVLNGRMLLLEADTHAHLNKPLLDSLTSAGLATEFLSADGTYKVPTGTPIVVEDVLTSTSATNALSANQGKVLDDKITLLQTDSHLHANKPLLDSLVSTGTGAAFLADDGTYKIPGGTPIIVENVLTSTSAVNALSANQGKILNDRLLLTEVDTHSHANKPLLDSLISTGTGAEFLSSDGTYKVPAGGGDIVGPAGAPDNSIAMFDGATGKLIKSIVCASGEVLQSNGTAFACATAGGGGIVVEDLLTSTSAVNALSANQGKILNDRLTLAETDSHTHFNKPLLDSLINTGLSTEYLSADGTYHVPVDNDTITIVEDTLASVSTVNALSANQGNVLDIRVATLEVASHTHANKALLDTLKTTGPAGEFLNANGVYAVPSAQGPSDVQGPGVSVDNDIAIFSGTTGKIIKDSGRKVDQMPFFSGLPAVSTVLMGGTAAGSVNFTGYKQPTNVCALDEILKSDGTDYYCTYDAGVIYDPGFLRAFEEEAINPQAVPVLNRLALWSSAGPPATMKAAAYMVDPILGLAGQVLMSNGVDTVGFATIIEDSLNSTSTALALSANQGRILNDRLALAEGDSHTHLNQALLDSLIDTGLPTEFLSADGTYHVIAGGSSVIVEDLLTSTSAVNALSANQGKVLNDRLLLTEADSHIHVNKPLLDSLVSTGTGAAFLADDGTYKVPVGGSGVLVEDTLTSTSPTNALSANQGNVLDGRINLLETDTHNHANKPLLDSLTSTGTGAEFLSSDGTYKVPAGGTSVIVEDLLTSTSAVNALSANQGKVLNDRLLLTEADSHNHANKPLLDSLVSTGTGAAFLADDGTYKIPAGGGTPTTVEDLLTSTSAINALSANQGKVLNDRLLLTETDSHNHANKILLDSLTDTGLATEFLSADGTYKVPAGNGTPTIVEDLLTSTSAVNALSANQGKVLNDRLLLTEAYSHNHANKPLLDSLISTGTGFGFLSDDGTYKIPIDTDTITIVEDTLTSSSTTNALSANQGKILDDKITLLQTDSHLHANKPLLDSLVSTGTGLAFLADDGTYKVPAGGGGGSGDVVGPATSVINSVAYFSDTTGKNIVSGLMAFPNPNITCMAGTVMKSDGTNWICGTDDGGVAGTGDVVGPDSVNPNYFAIFDDSTGKLIAEATNFSYLGGSVRLADTAGGTGYPYLDLGLNGIYLATIPGRFVELNDGGLMWVRPNGGFSLNPPATPSQNYSLTFPADPPSPAGNQILQSDGLGNLSWIPTPGTGGGNYVSGPATSIDNTVAIFDSTTGKLIKQATDLKFTNGALEYFTGLSNAVIRSAYNNANGSSVEMNAGSAGSTMSVKSGTSANGNITLGSNNSVNDIFLNRPAGGDNTITFGNNGKYFTLKSSQAMAGNISVTLPTTAPAANQILQSDGSGQLSWINTPTPGGTGNVAGPGSAVLNNLASYADGTGKVLKDSGLLTTNIPTMAAAGGAGMLLQTVAADRAISNAGVAVTNLATMAAAGGAGMLVQTAVADKALSSAGIAVVNIPTMAANGVAGNLLQTAAASKAISDSGIAIANVVQKPTTNFTAANRIVVAAGASRSVGETGWTIPTTVGSTGLVLKSDGTNVTFQADNNTALIVPTCTASQRLSGNGTTLSCLDNAYQVPAALDIDWNTSHVFYKSLSVNSTFTFSNQANGQVRILTVENTSGADISITLPASKWIGGVMGGLVKATSTSVFTILRANNVNYITSVENLK